ncbi:restriction endonuclease subunit S, partial [Rodentibacter pneumotropicus]
NNIILNKSDEIEKLTQLRDFLLPMLMNGQICVE